jgi:hypothetical protein
MKEWVVTFRIIEQESLSWGFAEFYRGSEEECRYIQDHFAGGECDIVRTRPWRIAIGLASEWYEFLEQIDDTGLVTKNDARPNRAQRRT